MVNPSAIDHKLTDRERQFLQMYRDPKSSDMRRQIRLAVQYALGTGIFLGMAIYLDQPLYAIVVYAVFILWMWLRLRGAGKLVGVMPGIIEKYEGEIRVLRTEQAPEDNLE